MAEPVRITLHTRPTAVRVATSGLEGISARVIESRVAESAGDAYRRGQEDGRREALEGAANALGQAAEELAVAHEEAIERSSELAIQLAMAIAGELTRAEVDAGRYDLERIVRETLAASDVGRGNCVVHLNPEDKAALEGVPFRSGTTIEADPNLGRSEVHVETPQGLLVREIDAALSSITERLLGALS